MSKVSVLSLNNWFSIWIWDMNKNDTSNLMYVYIHEGKILLYKSSNGNWTCAIHCEGIRFIHTNVPFPRVCSVHDRCWFLQGVKNNLLDHRSLTIKVLYNVRSFKYLMHVVSDGGEKALALIFEVLSNFDVNKISCLAACPEFLLLNCKGSVCILNDVKRKFSKSLFWMYKI